MSRIYIEYTGPKEDPIKLEIDEEDLITLLNWAEYKRSDLPFNICEETLYKNLNKLTEIRIKKEADQH